jgi:hypothetical protein
LPNKDDDLVLTEKWQAPVISRKVNTWMQRHTQYVNVVPVRALTALAATTASTSLDPQMCFNKAMETIRALKPTAELKKYLTTKSQWLRPACSLLVAEMASSLPKI